MATFVRVGPSYGGVNAFAILTVTLYANHLVGHHRATASDLAMGVLNRAVNTVHRVEANSRQYT